MSVNKPQSKAKPVRNAIAAAALVALAAVAFLMFRGSSTESDAATLHIAKRSDFLVSIVEGGTLKAVNDVKIRSEVEGSTRIISIVPEGTYVKRGDLLVELDSAEIRERLVQQEISYESNLSSFIQAREQLALQKSQAESTLKDAELKLEFARSDLAKFNEGDRPLQLQNSTNRITIIREELTRAEERFRATERLQSRGFATATELQADELAFQRKKLELTQATEEQRLLIAYDLPNRLRQLQSNVEQAGMELDRAQHRAASQIAQAEADLRSRESQLKLAESRLAQQREQLDKTRIYAPQDGLVVYALSSGFGSGGGGGSVLIEEGAQLRQRQEIIQLPDISQMMLEVKVHESHVGQVRPGQRAWVTIDSMPDRLFRGRVRRVSLLPDSQARWGNPNLKVYTTEVLVEEPLPGVNPGVSARAEIIITNLQQVVTLPIQAVTTLQGKQVAYVAQGRSSAPVPVEVGFYNDRFIEIRSGLNPGDRILLAPPITRDSQDALGSPGVTAGRRGQQMDGETAGTPYQPPTTAWNPQSGNGSGDDTNGYSNGGGERRGARGDGARMREELEALSPEEREARMQEMRERRGARQSRGGGADAGGGDGRR